jgi:hypothetical protein
MANTKQEKIINYGSVEHALTAERTSEKRTLKWLIVLQVCTVVVTVMMLSTFYIRFHSSGKEKHLPFTSITPASSGPQEGLAILYAVDPIAHSFCFRDGQYGETISDWTVYNRCSDLDFNGYYNGNFTVGVEGGRVGTIIDMGSPADLQRKYRYQETVGNGQGYASIHRSNSTLLILKESAPKRTYQAMEESSALFREGRSSATVSAKLGHIYAARITDRNDPKFERVVKMFVVAYEPNQSITIRWEVLV